MRKETGFTLIELMVTIALMALFAVFAIPAMNGFVEKQRVNSTLNNYTNALTFARNEAIRQNVPVVVCGAQISSAGQLSGCAPNTSSWSEGIFLFGDVNKDYAYSATGSDPDTNIRVVQSPNPSGGTAKVKITSAARSTTNTALSSNPVFLFLPNGQVARVNTSVTPKTTVVADMYLRLEVESTRDSKKKAVALMDPTGQIIYCTKKVIANNSGGAGNKIATNCAS